VANLFSAPVLSPLDELGIPFPLAKYPEKTLSAGGDLNVALERLPKLDTSRVDVTSFEKSLLDDAKEYL
jgi:hypothetical protein